MLIKRTRTKTRLSTDIAWEWTDDFQNEIIQQVKHLEESLIDSGVISSISSNISDDGLTHIKEHVFSSIENLVYFEKQTLDLDVSTGNLTNFLQHNSNHNITFTAAYVFEQ
jgi:hypothetical protein